MAARLRVSTSTLAKWRCAKTGPPFLRVGTQIRYDSRQCEKWLNSRAEETDENAATGTMREMELQVHRERPPVQRGHRFSGHQTKRERSEGHRGETSDGRLGGPNRKKSN